MLALLAALAFFAALALPHAALGKLFLQSLEPVAQALLILLQVAHALIALLAALAIAPRILALLVGLVAQLLLLADHVAEFVQRLLHVVAAGLAGLRHLQIFQHLLQLLEQLLGRILVAGTRQALHAVDHVLEVLLAQYLGIGIERPRQLLGIVALLFGELADEIIQRRAQVFGELLDLLVAGAAFQRLLERVLRGAQRLVDIGDVAVLDGDGERPQAGDHRAHRVVGAGGLELARDAVEAEILAGLGHEQLRRDHQRFERRIDLAVLIGVERQDAALLDQRARQWLGEQPLRQPHVERLALALIAGLVFRRQCQRHVGAGVRILAEILDGLADAVAGPRIRQHQRELRRLEQRPRRRGIFCGVAGARDETRLRFGDAVVVLDLVGHLQRAAGLAFRVLGQRDGRGAVGRGAEFPLRLPGGRADMRGAVAGDGEMAFVGAFGGLLGRRDFGHATAGHDIERAAAGAHDQRAAGRNRQGSGGGAGRFLVGRRQDDRGLAGIDRRRHPGIDPDIGRRQHAVPVERGGDPHRAFLARGHIGRDHHERDQRAQRPGIVDRQPRRRQAGADAFDRCQGALALRLPQRLRDRILRDQRIGEGRRRAMADAGAAV